MVEKIIPPISNFCRMSWEVEIGNLMPETNAKFPIFTPLDHRQKSEIAYINRKDSQ
jgi:hypothetical protein